MKKFDKLVIENFQSHTYTEVDFTEGFNVFVGPSDSGKSAILRALRWLLYNQPKGTDYIRAGKNRCRVSLTLSDGTVITRIRSASVNRYILQDPQGSEQVFEGFGSQVPEEVSRAHGMHMLKLSADWNLPAQFGSQLEGPFLLSETGSVKAKSIGRISGAHLIDMALQETGKDLRRTAVDLKYQTAEAERLKEELKPYEHLPQLIRDLDRSEAIEREAEGKHEKLQRVLALRERRTAVHQEKETVQERLNRLAGLEQVQDLLNRLESENLRYRQLERLRLSRGKLVRERTYWQNVLKASQHLNQIQHRLQELMIAKDRLSKLRTLHGHLANIRAETARYQRLQQQTEGIHQIDVSRLEEKEKMLKRLAGLQPRYMRVKLGKKEVNKVLQATERLPVQKVTRLEQMAERLAWLRKQAQKRADLRSRLEKGAVYLKNNAEQFDRLTEELVSHLRKLGRCPLCGSEIGSSVLEHLMEEYRGGVTGAAAGRED